MKVLVTGGAGFIGSALVRLLIEETSVAVVNVDKLTYATRPEALAGVADDPRYAFERADICDGPALIDLFEKHRPDAVVHLAAETHVDRAIDSPADFVQTNVVGTQMLLDVATAYWRRLDASGQDSFRFHHVSTDEVFGSIDSPGKFVEDSPYRPNSPYAASKAASDHLVRAWHLTYGLPTITTNSSNNYGPFQFPEKLIPLTIDKALRGKEIPVYGTGQNIRDWLHVRDHAEALHRVLTKGRVGAVYNVGGDAERTNLDVVKSICALLDKLTPDAMMGSRDSLITHVADRPGHDRRYALDISKIRRELGWRPRETFTSGLRKTVAWYLDNRDWLHQIRHSGAYAGERLGLGPLK